MRLVRRLALLCVIILGTSLIGASANAASAYDDLYKTTTQLTIGNDQGCDGVDLTYTWKDYIINSDTWEGRDFSAIKGSFQNALANGRIGVTEATVSNGSGTGFRQKQIEVYWTEDDSLSLTWSTEFGLYATSPNSNGYIVFIGCANNPYVYVNSSHNTTITTGYSFSGNAATVSNSVSTSVSWANAYRNLYVRTDSLNYPSGYEGAGVVTTAPALARYSGTIDCGGLEVQGVLISQDGNSGVASWSYESPGRATWSYSFNDNLYSVSIGCGGTPSVWATTNTSSGSVYAWQVSNNWVCNTFSHHCVLE